MQCGCPQCGALMAKRERGLKSECVCNWCGFTCNLCVGKDTDATPAISPGMTPAQWEMFFAAQGYGQENQDNTEEEEHA